VRQKTVDKTMKKHVGLFRLIFVSDQVDSSQMDTSQFVDEAKVANRKLGVTGALWFDGEHFLHLLEGSRAALNSLLLGAEKSPYHTDIDVICFGEVSQRIYGDWVLSYFGSETHNRSVAAQFAGGPDLCLRSLPSTTLLDMLSFLEEERQQDLSRRVG
jgi:Sensors of blue-light using FAD